ncbi:two-component sensor histidine kinase [Labrenzia sp. EL_132]|nr:two-component sensor histidine kinase [Labrenzia sp. EL_132]MBG6211553.1 two-component sensor histidine kinase [Labrenzia sp. EL_126]
MDSDTAEALHALRGRLTALDELVRALLMEQTDPKGLLKRVDSHLRTIEETVHQSPETPRNEPQRIQLEVARGHIAHIRGLLGLG